MGIATTTSETAFTQTAQEVYDFVTNPGNWPKTYPISRSVGSIPHQLPLKVGDVWTEGGPRGEFYTWQLALATPPKLWVFTSVGKLGHDKEGQGGVDGRITVQYHFSQPAPDTTLFSRTMTVEAYRDTPLPDELFTIMSPAHIDQYHAAVARELAT
jgi:hypothetical protein